MKKKAIQIYVTEQGKQAALEITKKDKKEFGTSARQCESVSNALIRDLNFKREALEYVVKLIQEGDISINGNHAINLWDFILDELEELKG